MWILEYYNEFFRYSGMQEKALMFRSLDIIMVYRKMFLFLGV